MHGRARMRLIRVINIICLVSLLENQETIKLYKDDFIHALCLIETSCDKGLISYYGKVFRVNEFFDLGSYNVLLETNYNLWA